MLITEESSVVHCGKGLQGTTIFWLSLPEHMKTPYDSALSDFFSGNEEHKLLLHNTYGPAEEMPLWYFFRSYEEMPDLEKMALSVCEGRVLDVGAGTGCHALVLQHWGHEVVALDTSQEAMRIAKESGIENAVCHDFFSYTATPFDTLLCLMNGIGFIGRLSSLRVFLKKASELLGEEGQIIVDSSDISYLYEASAKPLGSYYGEVSFQYEYRGKRGDWFDWVYIDADTLTVEADALGWHTYILHEENDQYLARLIRKK